MNVGNRWMNSDGAIIGQWPSFPVTIFRERPGKQISLASNLIHKFITPRLLSVYVFSTWIVKSEYISNTLFALAKFVYIR